eukprot:gene6559-9015_t
MIAHPVNLDQKQQRLLQSILTLSTSTISSLNSSGDNNKNKENFNGVVNNSSSVKLISVTKGKSSSPSKVQVSTNQSPPRNAQVGSLKRPDSKLVQSDIPVHFSGSAFLNSPDPSLLPLPDFEEVSFDKAAFFNDAAPLSCGPLSSSIGKELNNINSSDRFKIMKNSSKLKKNSLIKPLVSV